MTAIAKFALSGLLWEAAALGQAYFVPGDPKAGMQTFTEKGCMKCHSVLGEGGRTAPDLGRAPAGHLSAAELVAAMWNHAPAMWQRMRLEKLQPPKFGEAEMTDLFAFLYSVRSLDEPGDASRGRVLLSEKKCLECHKVSGQGRGAAPELERWASSRNPVSWIQAMWNHGPAMQVTMAQRGLEWPRFSGNDMADLIACIRTMAANPRPRGQMRQADPARGRAVFQEKHCARCHALGRQRQAGAPDLARPEFPRTLGQFAGEMWNHGPQMWSSMRRLGLEQPRFSNQEMADLIGYLFTARYFEPPADIAIGRRVFQEKGCAGCHTGAGGAPALASWRERASAVPIAAALWNHGPLMFTRMQQQGITWPRFLGGEVAALLEFLNSGGGSRPAATNGGRP